jgi:hypothetical protein
MDDNLIYTDTRPRAKSTGYAFGFQGNLGLALIIAALVSVFILTALLNAENSLPLTVKLFLALSPTIGTGAYLILFRARRPPRFDLDLLITFVNGPHLQPARNQPVHPFLPTHD